MVMSALMPASMRQAFPLNNCPRRLLTCSRSAPISAVASAKGTPGLPAFWLSSGAVAAEQFVHLEVKVRPAGDESQAGRGRNPLALSAGWL